ncbi:uncharacterized protein LOC131151495 [Malania oleifera]|uniref:uncharacterized protein LOC131151495 n=1 Tax=Malania oleifera TaxID=397392 RepID=UPI0025ADBDE3|nr:uncharacterized protein LOC131151495 [Malania oleifera]
MASSESNDQTNRITPPTTETSSPNLYFLNSNENPGNILVTQPLLGMKNYHSWSRAMILALTAKRKIGFTNDKIVEPSPESPLYEDWLSCNKMVISWMINSMHVDVSNSIMYCQTAREMWLELQKLFSQVTEYYTRFKKLWDQLLNLEPLPECTCGAIKALNVSHNKTYAMRFFMGLNENFENIRTQILMQEPFPSISKIYALVLQEESHKNVVHGGFYIAKPDSVAMYANSKGSNSGYKPKGRPSANQVIYNSRTAPENVSIQCPISKAQCEKLLTFLNVGCNSGKKNIAANVSTGNGLTSLVFGATDMCSSAGVTANADALAITSYPQTPNNYLENMSGIT